LLFANAFPATNLHPDVESMYLLRMCKHYCHAWNILHWTHSKFA